MENDVKIPASSPLAKERNYGIDALKILSMGMVVMLHVLGAGGG